MVRGPYNIFWTLRAKLYKQAILDCYYLPSNFPANCTKTTLRAVLCTPLGSISSTFHEQLLRPQIPKAQKRQSSQQCCLTLLGPTSVKAFHKMLMKLTPGLRSIVGHCYSKNQFLLLLLFLLHFNLESNFPF